MQKKTYEILAPLMLDDGIIDQVTYAEKFASHFSAKILYLHVLPLSKGTVDEVKDRQYNLLEDDITYVVREKVMSALETVRPYPDSSPSLTFRAGNSVVEEILNEAVSKGSDFILCGTRDISHRILPEALSTVLSLMNHSTIPIIVNPTQRHFEFDKGNFCLVLADDLSEENSAAVKWSINLANQIADSRVFHIHIQPSTREEFIVSFYANAGEWGITLTDDYDPGLIYDQKMDLLRQKLKNRLAELDIEHLVDKARYQSHLLSGSVSEVIAQQSAKDHADLIVFGRHHFMHKHPMNFGKVSYRTMLEQKCSVAIVPSESSPKTQKIVTSAF